MQTLEQLLFIMGLALGQSLQPHLPLVDTALTSMRPVAIIEAQGGHRHAINFPDQSATEAVESIQAALAMHFRDLNAFAVLEPQELKTGGAQALLFGTRKYPESSAIRGQVRVIATGATVVVVLSELELNGAVIPSEASALILAQLERGLKQQLGASAINISLQLHYDSI